jgi:cytochrome c-type biogenesis protein CcmE
MRRGIIAVALICAFVVLAAYYLANVTQHLDYPRESEVSANHVKYVGQPVTISGSVVATGAQSFELKGVSSTYTILSSSTAVRTGDVVTVVGTLEPGNQLHAQTVYVSSALLSALVYVRSFIAFVFVVVLFFMGWQFDRRGRVIRPRETDGERTPKQGGG